MVIKGTPKIRGVLDLHSIKRQIKKDDDMPISDSDYWNSDVQIALKMGYITAISDQHITNQGDPDRVVKLVNRLKTPINIPNQNHPVPAGAQFTLRESEIRDPDVRLAITKGIIQVLSILEQKQTSEGFLKLGESTDKLSSIQDEKIQEEPNNITPAQVTLIKANQSYQRNHTQEKPIIDTNEELPEPKSESMPANVIDTDKPNPIKTSDMPDPLGKSVIFNPTGAKPINVIKNATVANPRNDESITFVDEEQTQERINKHPKLEPKQTTEVELVDLEDVGTRRNPKLPTKTEKDDN